MLDRDRDKWDAIHRERGYSASSLSDRVVACEALLPRPQGSALDVAGGTGRHSLWLARCGFDVTLTDISQVALQIASAEARERNVTLTTIHTDLEEDPFPTGPWDVIVCTNYLHRPLFASFAETLSPRGVLIFAQPTRRNLERHPRPSARFLLEEGELSELVIQSGLDIVLAEEKWSPDGRHEAFVIAKRGASQNRD